jgi:hypothetical protein
MGGESLIPVVFWIAFGLVVVIQAIVKDSKRRGRESRRLNGFCPTCGYDLTGNVSGTCPECGGR